MDRPVVASPADEHWAPDHVVLARRVLGYAGRLLVERDEQGYVVATAPLEGMAAVEHRYPAWAMGPFGRIETERRLPGQPGVYALVRHGTPLYVGSSADLARSFGPRGFGEISRRDAQQPKHEERCRINRLVVAEAEAGRTVDLYVLPTERRGLLRRAEGETADDIAREILREGRGPWHLPA